LDQVTIRAGNNGDADVSHEYLTEFCHGIPSLTIVRNDGYARFCHQAAAPAATAIT
jgi:hypothetical protein